jgi:hypothetical protein
MENRWLWKSEQKKWLCQLNQVKNKKEHRLGQQKQKKYWQRQPNQPRDSQTSMIMLADLGRQLAKTFTPNGGHVRLRLQMAHGEQGMPWFNLTLEQLQNFLTLSQKTLFLGGGKLPLVKRKHPKPRSFKFDLRSGLPPNQLSKHPCKKSN